jgi:hypothetical protein
VLRRSPAGINRCLHSLRKLGRFAVMAGLRNGNPAQKVRLLERSVHSAPRTLVEAEVGQLVEVAQARPSRTASRDVPSYSYCSRRGSESVSWSSYSWRTSTWGALRRADHSRPREPAGTTAPPPTKRLGVRCVRTCSSPVQCRLPMCSSIGSPSLYPSVQFSGLWLPWGKLSDWRLRPENLATRMPRVHGETQGISDC